MNVKVAASTAIPHSIRMRREVRTVKRASPTFTTDEGFGFGSHWIIVEQTSKHKIQVQPYIIFILATVHTLQWL